MTTKGTREWADSNVNCYIGCSNNCRYCYARNFAFRFKRINGYDEWKEMKPNVKAINKGYRKRKGRIMFPTSHDITVETKNNCLQVLFKLLVAGNDVLITTKPVFNIIVEICKRFEYYKNQIQFRFTITSKENNILKFFEPNAPLFQERLESLKWAFEKGFKTSVSIEPFLDTYLNLLIKKISPYITETIWIGTMSNLNKVMARGLWEIMQIPHDPAQYNEEVDTIRKMIRYMHDIHQPSHITLFLREIMNEFQFKKLEIYDKLRLKDSIRNMGFEL